MKHVTTLIIISLITLSLFIGCTTKSTVAPVGMTAVAGDHSFSVSDGMISANKSTGTLYITASDTVNHRSISLTVYNYVAQTGNVTIDGVYAQGSYDSTASAFTVENGSHGTITFSAVAPQIVGTFNFTCTDSTKVSNGTFSVAAPL